jgi:hypothetical protein
MTEDRGQLTEDPSSLFELRRGRQEPEDSGFRFRILVRHFFSGLDYGLRI